EVALTVLGRTNQAGDRVAGAQIEAPDLTRAHVDVVGTGQIRAVRRAQEPEAVLQDLEDAVAVDILARARVRLQNREDDVLLARARKILETHLLSDFDELRNGLQLQLRQIHRLTRGGKLRWGDDAYVVGVEVVDRQIVVLLLLAVVAAVAIAVVAALAIAALARTITGLIAEIASHSLLSKNAARSDFLRAPTFWPSTWPF